VPRAGAVRTTSKKRREFICWTLMIGLNSEAMIDALRDEL
jgi:hypothetical protein